MPSFDALRVLDDATLLLALRKLYAPGVPEPVLAELTKALRGRVIDVPVPGGAVQVDLGDWTSILLVRLGGWEPHLARLARLLVHPGEVAVDAGAHVGTWTLLLASLAGERGRVVAFEPWPASVASARSALEAAGFGGRAEVIQAALGAREGRAKLFGFVGGARFSGADAMLRSLVLADGYSQESAVDVRVTTLDASGLARVDFLKLDTEGAELEVLRGARALLARSPDVRVLVELHAEELATQGASGRDVVAELQAQGLTVFDLRPHGVELRVEPLAPDAAPSTHHVLARRDPSPFEVSLLGQDVFSAAGASGWPQKRSDLLLLRAHSARRA